MTATPVLLTGVGPTPMSWGRIGSAGEIIGGSGDFTSERTATGVYKITWGTARANSHYAVVASLDAIAAGYVTVTIVSATVVEISCFNTSATHENDIFNFVCLGP